MIIQTQLTKNARTTYRSGAPVKETRTPASAPMPSRYQGRGVRSGNGSGNGSSNGSSNGSHNGASRSNGRKTRKKSGRITLWTPWKMILLSILLGIAGSIYLTHVFETQNTLREVQQLRREYERAHRVHTEVRRNYDRMTGPAEVYNRAASLGMISGGAADPVIVIER
ncbi:MAG: hypothetical protein EA363_09690 [Balneolaceae bacterium]|nr:MAG: hypothetical protein EA363_09690 [Balneolaceae bacterium]